MKINFLNTETLKLDQEKDIHSYETHNLNFAVMDLSTISLQEYNTLLTELDNIINHETYTQPHVLVNITFRNCPKEDFVAYSDYFISSVVKSIILQDEPLEHKKPLQERKISLKYNDLFLLSKYKSKVKHIAVVCRSDNMYAQLEDL